MYTPVRVVNAPAMQLVGRDEKNLDWIEGEWADDDPQCSSSVGTRRTHRRVVGVAARPAMQLVGRDEKNRSPNLASLTWGGRGRCERWCGEPFAHCVIFGERAGSTR